MIKLTIRLPESLQAILKKEAQKSHISLNQLIVKTLLAKYKETSKNISKRERIVNILRENDMLVESKNEWAELIKKTKNANIEPLRKNSQKANHFLK
jgi:hypothetical protein